MQNVINMLQSFLDKLTDQIILKDLPKDILDVLVVAFLIYHGIRLVRETRAMQLVKGIAAIMLVYFFAWWWELNTLRFVVENIIGSGVLLIVILFQPELRRALEQMGRSKISGFGLFSADSEAMLREQYDELIKTICESAAYLSERKTGALIVLERETRLGEIIKTGTVVDAQPSLELIANIFFTNSPLHDGAMVIRGNRVYAAGCYLPLSANMEISRELGTRHRAALGMSEVSDAVVIVVSEETGAVSVALDSRLQRNLSGHNLDKLLHAKLLGKLQEEGAEKKKPAFWRAKK